MRLKKSLKQLKGGKEAQKTLEKTQKDKAGKDKKGSQKQKSTKYNRLENRY